MSGQGRQPDRQPGESDHHSFANAAWSIPGYILSGMAVYGGLGWLLDHWLGTSALFPIGIVVGLGLAIFLVYYRYGR